MKQKLTIIIIALILTALPFAAQAAGLVPCGGPNEDPCTVKDIFVLVARVTNTLIGLAGIYAVWIIVSAGFWMVVSAGNEEAISGKRKQITNAIVGLAVVMMAFMVVNTVVNVILFRNTASCKLNLSDPLSYMTIKDDDYQKCKQDFKDNLKPK